MTQEPSDAELLEESLRESGLVSKHEAKAGQPYFSISDDGKTFETFHPEMKD